MSDSSSEKSSSEKSSRRKNSMRKIVMYWRDIPSMVTIKRGREKGKLMLAPRFQEAIDRAAMRAGKGGSDLYIEEWRSDTSDYQTDLSLQEAAALEVAALEALFGDELIKRMVKNNGNTPEN
ncbi:MAG: hypothetical protein ACJAQ6_000444 [Arenicella sp.]|jgi:hypothetical protein